MADLDLIQIGEVIRKVRKSRGLRLEDLADQKISPATVSNIERGVPHVGSEKVLYLLDKLGISLQQIPEILEEENEKLEELLTQLMAVESKLNIIDNQRLLNQLNELPIDDQHKLAAYRHYLMGRCYFNLKDLKRAERAYYHAIRLSGQSSYSKEKNIEALSFNELGICSFYQNDLEQAIQYTESALDAVNGDSTDQYKFACNKAAYLEKLGRIGETVKIVQELWEHIDKMDLDVALNLYDVRVNVFRKSKMFEEAIQCAKEGIEKARLNDKKDRLFELWTALGSVYLSTQDWNKAETCFQTAVEIGEAIDLKIVLVSTYTKLGILYIRQQKEKEAEESLNRAIQLGKDANNAIALTYAHLVMGDLKQTQEKWKESSDFYKQSLELSRKFRNKTLEYKALFRLAKLKKGDSQEEFLSVLENIYEVAAAIAEESKEEESDEIL
ncbi:helix-turn-helix domain-containing protein [Polycladomyces subterraneus]|uniref:Helix-turn-helix transcriptional regulator n=1 Tax=Polycladomyces subterraneus TaxID=1016997 RepID=A0ABT8IK10_9BACL|nr:helix-turn-helix transcriptional regulator [Polycladomyces subterraneus]MDN4593135.1 helix-turn-helix transcriptional regulator [Polycladomyces subterraneus]